MRHPLPHYEGCYVCGEGHPRRLNVRFYVEAGRVVTRLATDESHQGYPGVVHGGVIAALLDETMGWAPCVRLGRFCVAAEITVRYLRPAPIGTTLVVTGEATRAHPRLWEATGEVKGTDGRLYARGSGKYVPLSEAETERVMALLTVEGRRLTLREALAAAAGEGESDG